MTKNQRQAPFILSGRLSHRVRSLLALYWATLSVSGRRLLRGPRFINWGWDLETSARFMQAQAAAAFKMADIRESRAFEDALIFHSPALERMSVEVVSGPVKGSWYRQPGASGGPTLLYLHGGGFAYYTRAHHNLIALVCQAAGGPTFALDYRLAPEHPYPAQLEDALAAYRWLLKNGADPQRLVVAGDSAGGNLALALLQALRQADLPQPALAVCLGPWTDLSNPGASMQGNAAHDWIDGRMAGRWAQWYCGAASPDDPLISPARADLSGLAPIYMQAGSAEVLLDMIRDFALCARQQGARVRLDVWPNMVHDFQAFGSLVHESQDALVRLGEQIQQHTS